MRQTSDILGPRHTQYFCTQYCDKKIFFLQNIVVAIQNLFKLHYDFLYKL